MGFDPRIFRPLASCYTNYAIRDIIIIIIIIIIILPLMLHSSKLLIIATLGTVSIYNKFEEIMENVTYSEQC